MIRVYPDGDGEDANDSHCGPPYFYVGKFCFFLVFVLSNQTEAGTPCPFKAIWSGYGRRSVFFQPDSCEGNDLERRSISCCRGPADCSVAGCQNCRQLFGHTVSSSWKVVRILAVFDILSCQYLLFFRYFSERVKRHVVTTTAWSFYGKKVPSFVQTHHYWACHVPQPHVFRAHGRYGHHQRRLHRPQIHGFL